MPRLKTTRRPTKARCGNLCESKPPLQKLERAAASGAWIRFVVSSGSGVTSLALTAPSIMTVTGSPITTAGTIALGLTTEAANTVFSGPASGAAATPTFRGLATADIPATVALLAGPTFTGVPKAPTAATNTSTTQLATTAFANPAATLAANGSITLPSGVMINWNSGTTNSSGVYTWTYATAFPTLTYAIVASPAAYAVGQLNVVVSATSNSQATLYAANAGTGAAILLNMVAIGH